MARRRRRFSRLSLFYLMVLMSILIGSSVWLDRRGEVVDAVVKSKQEDVTVEQVPEGGWDRWYRVGVEFSTSASGLGMATVNLPEQRYDSLHLGDTLPVRYLPSFPLIARTVDRSTADVIWEATTRLAAAPFLAAFLPWLAIGLVALWIASRIGTPVVVIAGLAWIGAAFPLLFSAPPPLPPVTTETTARVHALTLVAKSPARQASRRRSGRSRSDSIRRLAVPYQVVQLRIAVPGRPDSVLAVDAVDSASAVGLKVGSMVPVRYDPSSPREARLSRASRSFRGRNRYHFLIPVVGVGVLGMLAAWGWRSRR
jgi:hypothetical protein